MQNHKTVEFTPQQAKDFAKRYQVVATSAQYGIGAVSGFSATLFSYKENGVKKYVFAIRGTSISDPRDWYADAQIATGKPVAQAISMELFYRAILNDSRININADSRVTVTGHSLGGFLGQVFAAIHPDAVDHVYTYNAPGIGGISAQAAEVFGFSGEIPSSRVSNIYAEEGPETISKLGTMVGSTVPVSVGKATHRIGALTDSLRVYAVLDAVSGGTTDIAVLTGIMKGLTDKEALLVARKKIQQSDGSGFEDIYGGPGEVMVLKRDDGAVVTVAKDGQWAKVHNPDGSGKVYTKSGVEIEFDGNGNAIDERENQVSDLFFVQFDAGRSQKTGGRTFRSLAA